MKARTLKVGDEVTVVLDVGDGFYGMRGVVVHTVVQGWTYREYRVQFDCGALKWYAGVEVLPVDAVTMLGEVADLL